MSARQDDEQPIAYELTEAGEAAVAAATGAVVTYTAAEAAKASGAGRDIICSLARRGLVDAVKVDGQWLIDGGSLHEYWRRTTPGPPAGPGQRRLPAAPLLRQIELAGGDDVIGVRQHTAEKRMLERARYEGTVTLWAADHMAVKLGLTVWDLWDL